METARNARAMDRLLVGVLFHRGPAAVDEELGRRARAAFTRRALEPRRTVLGQIGRGLLQQAHRGDHVAVLASLTQYINDTMPRSSR